MCFESKEAAFAAVCRERDELRQIVEKQAGLNQRVVDLALQLDAVTAERDAYLYAIKRFDSPCPICAHMNDAPPSCEADCDDCTAKCHCHACDKFHSNFVWIGGEAHGQEKAGQP